MKIAVLILAALAACFLWTAAVDAVVPESLFLVELLVCAVGGWFIGKAAWAAWDAWQ